MVDFQQIGLELDQLQLLLGPPTICLPACFLISGVSFYHLTGRLQYVQLHGCVLDRLVSNTKAPHETVPSLFIFTLYTTNCYRSESCHLY